MQTVNFKVWLIGATLSVVPIFYSAVYSDAVLAQSSSNQGSSMVLEMQQLRAEIADLRDQLERQQYQIRQLQRSLQQGNTNQAANVEQSRLPVGDSSGVDISDSQNNNAIDASAVPQPNAGVVASSASSGNATSGNLNSSAPRYGNAAVDAELPNPQTASIPNQNLPDQAGSQPALPAGEDDFYRPLPQSQGAAVVDENPEVVSAARQARQADNTYPPVIDRSIGGNAGAPAPTVSQGPGSQNTPVVGNNTQTNPVLAAPPAVATQDVQQPTTIPAQNPNTGSGVIQIPRNSLPSNSQATNPVSGTAVPGTVASATPVLAEDEYYQQGFDLLKQSRYTQAVDIFKEQISHYPEGSYADDAHYWIAESMYLNRSLPESKKYFRAIINNFQQSPRLPDAMLKTAYIEQEQGNEIEARILLQEIIQYHPRSDAAISAKNRLEKLD